jgi:hypothetical protein
MPFDDDPPRFIMVFIRLHRQPEKVGIFFGDLLAVSYTYFS